GNITPASMGGAVSLHATSSMFMPNSPTPPSGITSTEADVDAPKASNTPKTSSYDCRTSAARGHGPRAAPARARRSDSSGLMDRWEGSGAGRKRRRLYHRRPMHRAEQVGQARQFLQAERLGAPSRVEAGQPDGRRRRPAEVADRADQRAAAPPGPPPHAP